MAPFVSTGINECISIQEIYPSYRLDPGINARGLEKPEAMGNEKTDSAIFFSMKLKPGAYLKYIPSLYPTSSCISTELYELEIIVIMMILIQMQ
jgi:hypothetical protein